jgi:amino acid transporter
MTTTRDARVRVSASDQDAADAAQLAALGYNQQLTRALGLWQNFSVGFTYLSPLVGVYSLFAFGLAAGGPAFLWSIPIVVLGQSLVLLTFAEVSSQYPLAGGIYQWAKRLVGSRYAWLAGWMYTWALLITVAAVAFPISAYAGPLLGYRPTTWTTVATAVVAIVFAGLVNTAGVRRLALIATVGLVAEVLGTAGLGLYLLLFERHHGLGVVLKTYGAGSPGHYTSAFLGAALFAVFIFYGFEACGDIAEEVRDPSRKIPRAMIMTMTVGAFATALLSLGLLLSVKDLGAVVSGQDADPIGTVLGDALGSAGTKVVLALIVVGFVSCTVAIQGATARLVYSYARDGMIVGARALSTLHPRLHMPLGAIGVATVVPVLITLLPSATVTKIITFASVGIYVGFQSVVVSALIGRSRGWRPSGAFTLGRWGWGVNAAALVYGVTAIVVLCVKGGTGTSFVDRWLVPLSVAVVLAAGLLYLLVLRPEEDVRADARSGGPLSTARP